MRGKCYSERDEASSVSQQAQDPSQPPGLDLAVSRVLCTFCVSARSFHFLSSAQGTGQYSVSTTPLQNSSLSCEHSFLQRNNAALQEGSQPFLKRPASLGKGASSCSLQVHQTAGEQPKRTSSSCPFRFHITKDYASPPCSASDISALCLLRHNRHTNVTSSLPAYTGLSSLLSVLPESSLQRFPKSYFSSCPTSTKSLGILHSKRKNTTGKQ